jgi:DNA-binding CsgD family transcriptional regulator
LHVDTEGALLEGIRQTCESPALLRGRNDAWLAAVRALDATPDRLTILLVEGALGTGKSRFLQEVTGEAVVRGFSLLPQDDRYRPVSAIWWRDSMWPLAGIHAKLGDNGSGNPVMLGVDDVHAAHSDLVWELFGIIRYRQNSPIVLALARRESLTQVPEFERYLASADNVVRVRLEALHAAETAEVAADILGVPAGGDVMDFLADAGGNPLLLTELLKGLREEGALAYVSGAARLLSPALPQRIQRLVSGLVREFSPATQQVLRVAATMGTTLDVHRLAGLRNEPVSSLLPAIDELFAAGLLASRGQLIAFNYPLVRKALIAAMPTSLVTALQRQAAVEPDPDLEEPAPQERLSALTDNERAIAELAAAGLTNGQIARRVNKSSHTVNFHLRKVFRKLGIRSRVELARLQ